MSTQEDVVTKEQNEQWLNQLNRQWKNSCWKLLNNWMKNNHQSPIGIDQSYITIEQLECQTLSSNIQSSDVLCAKS